MPGQFSNFYNSLDSDENRRGKQFEIFVKFFLKKDPVWATQVAEIWLWNEWPDCWGKDCGIDLVFQHKNGDYWAVQAKCYAPNYNITKHDVDKFLSESNRPIIKHRLLIATTDIIGKNAKQVCDAQEKPVIRFLLSDFEKSELDYPANFDALSQTKRKNPAQPHDYQNKAITTVVKKLQSVDRGKLIMACGTGKTLVTLWIKENLNAQRTLVLLPSLGLLSQLLSTWAANAATPFEVLCVCSDKTVGASSNQEESIESVKDLPFPVITNGAQEGVEEIKKFLSSSGNRVVFSTYQSSKIIAAAQDDASIPAFDLIVADEAHRCAGDRQSIFTTVLDNSQIRSKKRLFATATPRIYTSSVHKAAENRGIEIIGMDDTNAFGEELHTLSFSEAIAKNLLTDYRVVIIGVDDPTIAQWISKRELINTTTGVNTDSESLATQIGLLKAIKDYDLKRIISFHSRINRAEKFTTDVNNIIKWIDKEHLPNGALRTDFISGHMSAGKRKNKLKQFENLKENERKILSNARCLSEGVDVPSLDGVAFIDPRSSQVDIIQAVGRAIRLSENKKIGTIVLPVFITPNQNAQAAIELSNFKPVWDVLNALKSHDNTLSCELEKIRTKLGRKQSNYIGINDLEKISIDLPITVDANFSNALRTYLVEQVTDSWNFWMGLLEAFVEREGHCSPSALYKTQESYRLGRWVVRQRTSKNSMLSERRIRLEALPGWRWNIIADQWEKGLQYLKEFMQQNGHARVSDNFITIDGYRLGQWAGSQRNKKNKLSLDRQLQLEALPGWYWNANTEKWEKGLRYLKEFVQQNGHARVSDNFITTDDYRLGNWVSTQRIKQDKLSDEQKTLLETFPGWYWDVRTEHWEKVYLCLKDFAEREGHVLVPQDFKTANGFRVKHWIGNQRAKRHTMSLERRTRLEALPGWTWEVITEQWEKGFRCLTEFAAREGHIKIPVLFETTDSYKLGTWVSAQRSKKDSLSPEKVSRLEAVAGWSWDMLSEQWEEGFRHLKEYSDREGHANVPALYKSQDDFKTGVWLNTQRTNKNKLSAERIARLEALPGWMWDAIAGQWEKGFDCLKKFIEYHGHARVPQNYKTDDEYPLGTWVNTQRQKINSMPPERKAQLEVLPGWSWEARADRWEEGFSRLKIFLDQYGHTKVHRDYKTVEGYPLGAWLKNQLKRIGAASAEKRKRLEALGALPNKAGNSE